MDEAGRSEGPIPQPRNNCSKKPVPLPRTNASKKESTDNTSSSVQESESKPKLNYTNSLRRSLKIVTGNVQEKGSAVLESTKYVGAKIEKSVRGILSKRQNVISMPDRIRNDSEFESDDKLDSSLSCTDIFNEIRFGSPIATSEAKEDLKNCDSYSVSFSEPPSYPPPPLPDESIYDEVQSTKSSVSESFYSCPSGVGPFLEPDSYYEEVPHMKKLSLFDESDDSEFSYNSEVLPQGPKKISRSKSWTFYHQPTSVPNPNVSQGYVNVTIEDNIVKLNSVDNIYSEEPTKPTVINRLLTGRLVTKPESEVESVASSKTNELYENWSVGGDKSSEDSESIVPQHLQTTKSVIYEFDPLYVDEPIVPNVIPCSHAKVLPVMKEMNDSESNAVSEGVVEPLPEPPQRYDSLLEQEEGSNQFINSKLAFNLVENDKPQTGAETGLDTQSSGENILPLPGEQESNEKKMGNLTRWSVMKKAIRMVADGKPWSPLAARRVQRHKMATPEHRQQATRPKIGLIPVGLHQGSVFRSPSNGEKTKDFVPRWGQLAEGKLCFSSDSTKNLKEFIAINSILSIHLVTDRKVSIEAEDVHCFEVNTGARSRAHVIGCSSSSERGLWMQKLFESMTDLFPSSLTAQYTIAGWCFLKEGISGPWKSAWVLLEKRSIFFCHEKGKVIDVDLRKARCIVLQNDGDGFRGATETGPYIMVDSPERALYLQFDFPRETKLWRQVIKSTAVNNGSSLYDQQLTKDDIPVIVDKCINFVYAHGSMSEGIYRRNGSSSKVSKLLSDLRKNAWAVQLSRQEYSEYDVGTALKRFFRDLPEPLLSPTLYKYFCNASSIKCTRNEKVSMYRHALEKLSAVNYVTTRRLIGHLYFIHVQSDKNRMPVDNLAALWGPTIMHVEGNGGMTWAKKECEVVSDLIQLYKSVFLVDGEEMAREERIMEVLERFHNTPLPNQRPSGDLKVWIYIGSKESGECVNISVGPNCDAGSICKELCSRTEFSSHELCLTETVLGGALSRPLHHTELVLDTVLRWVNWDTADCKDNYLVLTPNTVFREMVPIAKPPMTKCGELKYADPKSKSFKTYLFEFSQAKLSYYKDKACSIKLSEWKIEDIIWYIGHEPKRNPQSRWTVTFIDKEHKIKRSNESPYFGHTIAGSTKDEQLQWMTTLLLSRYPHTDLLPRPNLLE